MKYGAQETRVKCCVPAFESENSKVGKLNFLAHQASITKPCEGRF